MLVVGRRGNQQYRADRLDAVAILVIIEVGDHLFSLRLSSVWAKKADTVLRISLARFRSRFSRSSAFSRSRSEVVRPSRSLWSRYACLTHFRSVSVVQPSLVAMDAIAAHCELCSPWCSNTKRTTRSSTSGEYLLFVFMTLSPQEIESPVNTLWFITPNLAFILFI